MPDKGLCSVQPVKGKCPPGAVSVSPGEKNLSWQQTQGTHGIFMVKKHHVVSTRTAGRNSSKPSLESPRKELCSTLQKKEKKKKSCRQVPVCPGGKIPSWRRSGQTLAVPWACEQDLPPSPMGWSPLPGLPPLPNPSLLEPGSASGVSDNGKKFLDGLALRARTFPMPGKTPVGAPKRWGKVVVLTPLATSLQPIR